MRAAGGQWSYNAGRGREDQSVFWLRHGFCVQRRGYRRAILRHSWTSVELHMRYRCNGAIRKPKSIQTTVFPSWAEQGIHRLLWWSHRTNGWLPNSRLHWKVGLRGIWRRYITQDVDTMDSSQRVMAWYDILLPRGPGSQKIARNRRKIPKINNRIICRDDFEGMWRQRKTGIIWNIAAPVN